MYKVFAVFALLGFLAVTTNANAGKVSFVVDQSNRTYVKFTGDIDPGDAERLKRKMESSRFYYLWSRGLIIDSGGGSVLEAIKIGKFVEKSNWRVDVQRDSVCASACFLIYVAAPIRLADGKLIIHRPCFVMDDVTGEHAYQTGIKYQDVISKVRSYLKKYMVPDYLIEIMMSKGSSQGYTLTSRDLARVGFFSPAMDEYQLQECGFPVHHLITKPELANTQKCREQYSQQARLRMLYGKGYASASKAFAELTEYMRELGARLPASSPKFKAALRTEKNAVDTLQPREWLHAVKAVITSQP